MTARGNPVFGVIRRLIPPSLRPRARALFLGTRWRLRTSAPWRVVRRFLARGNAVTCPCCEQSFARFLPFRGRANAECPNCFSLERHRLLWLFLRDRTKLLNEPTRFLHFAPEIWLSRTLAARSNIRYVSVDKYAGGVMAKADMTTLPFPDASFDGMLEVHVLQNIEDEAAAIRELRRVLRPGGWAVIHENLDLKRTTTLEDPSIWSKPQERERVFGFHEYARRYGRDFPTRITPFGFESKVIDLYAELGPEQARRYGLQNDPVHLFVAAGNGGAAGR